jgi:hypothetical protein
MRHRNIAPQLHFCDESLEGSGMPLRIQAAAQPALEVEANDYAEGVDDEFGGGGVVAAFRTFSGGDHALVGVTGTQFVVHVTPP